MQIQYNNNSNQYYSFLFHVRVFQKRQFLDASTGLSRFSELLAIFRNDIISYRPNANFSFIGEDLNAVHSANTIEELERFLVESPKFHTMNFKDKFKGSTNRIINFINKLCIEQ